MSKEKFSPFLKVTKCINPPIPEGIDSIVEYIKQIESESRDIGFIRRMNLISQLRKYIGYLNDDVHKVEVYESDEGSPTQIDYMYGEDVLERFLPVYERLIPNLKTIRE